MAIILVNADTNQRWELPNSVSASTFRLSDPPYSQGDYKITNGSGATLTIAGVVNTTVAAGAIKSVSTKPTLYSWIPVAVDYAVWNSHVRGNNGRAG